MDLNFLKINDSRYLSLLLVSLIIIIIFSFIKKLIQRFIQSNESINNLEQIELIKKFNSYLTVVQLLFIFTIWFQQLQSILLSLFAVAAALVLATKELIMTFTGGLLIKYNNLFRLGDRIEIDGSRGFVIEKNLNITKLLEIGPDKNSQQTTGNIIAIPNSTFLSKNLKNESYFKDYSIKSFSFKLPENVELEEFEKEVLSWGIEESKEHLAKATETIGSFCRKEGIIIPSVEPRAKLVLNDENKCELLLKIPIANQSIGDIEQNLVRKYIHYTNKIK